MIAEMNETLGKILNEQYGYITSEDVENLGREYDAMQVLVRTGCNRYVCALVDLNKVFETVDSKGDYVRDVCLTAEQYHQIKENRPIFTHKIGSIRQVHPDPK
jgi:hypothetical protein